MRITVRDLARLKQDGRKFVMLTAYDHLTAGIVDEAGVPVILVGDSLAQVMLGYETTLPVTMEEMLHHTRAVARGAGNAMVVADMPFGSYQTSLDDGFASAVRFLKEGGAQGVKLEGPQVELTQRLVDHGVPVMAHLGLTPQSVHALGGYRVQGRSREAADRMLSDAHSMEKAGAFSLVLEAIPAALAAQITSSVSIPTIGIGAGSGCDAQVLVITDLLGLGSGQPPKFVKPYANLRSAAVKAIAHFVDDVTAGSFPDDAHTYE